MKLGITIPNLPRVRSALKKSPAIVIRNINQAIRFSIQQIHRETVPLTPHQFGRLEQSLGTGIAYFPLGGRIGSDLEYAVPQHEHTEWKHPIKGQAKYLEVGMRNADPHIKKAFTEALDQSLREIARDAH